MAVLKISALIFQKWFEELEGHINSLQDELDEIRERARRAFQVA